MIFHLFHYPGATGGSGTAEPVRSDVATSYQDIPRNAEPSHLILAVLATGCESPPQTEF